MEKDWFNRGADRLQKVYFSPIRAVGDKANALAKQGHPVIKFSIGEPDFDTEETVKEAAIKALKANKTHYAANRGLLELRQEIAKRMEIKHGLHYDPETEILITCGGAEGIFDTILAFLNPGDEAIVFTPAFMNYENIIYEAGAQFVDIPLKAENGFQIDPEELEAAVTDRTRMIIMNNPSNPLGVVFHDDVLEKVAEIAVKHNLVVFTDEIYNDIVYDGVSCRSICTYPGMRERTVTMNGFSKGYAMTGWRLGYVFGTKELINCVHKVHQYNTTCIPTFIQYGAAEAMNLPETEAGLDRRTRIFDERRKLVMAALDDIKGLSYVRPEGAFYIFVDVSGTGLDGQTFADRLLNEAYVAVVPGTALGSWCKDYVRISYATSTENLKEGFARIKKFVEGL